MPRAEGVDIYPFAILEIRCLARVLLRIMAGKSPLFHSNLNSIRIGDSHDESVAFVFDGFHCNRFRFYLRGWALRLLKWQRHNSHRSD
jgi:hypothetical protein